MQDPLSPPANPNPIILRIIMEGDTTPPIEMDYPTLDAAKEGMKELTRQFRSIEAFSILDKTEKVIHLFSGECRYQSSLPMKEDSI